MPAALLCLLVLLLPGTVRALCSWSECNCTLLEQPPNSAALVTLATCLFPKRQRVELESSDLEETLGRVELGGGRDLRFGAGVFSRLPLLEAVIVRNVSKVFVQKGSFANMSSPQGVRFEFHEATSLVLEEHSFRNLRGPVSALVSRVSQVIVQRAAFAWLSDLTVSSVPRLELLDEAFLLENPKTEINVPSTTITLENVFMESLGRNTFHSLLSEVRIVGSEVKRVRADAFNAMFLGRILVENSTLHKIESGAFSGRTLIDTLRLSNVKIHELATNAVLSGLNHLTIRHSKLGTVQTSAINITVAAVTLSDNVVGRVYRKGFNLKEWNSMSLVNNTFKWLEGEAFSAAYQSQSTKPASGPEYNFTGNVLLEVGANAFDVELSEELLVEMENNVFSVKCHCDMKAGVKALVTGVEAAGELLFETSLCSVDRLLAGCFGLSPGLLNMRNFTAAVCEAGERILCEEVQRDAAVPARVPSITSAVDVVLEEELEREKKVLGSVFLLAVTGMLLMMAMSGFMWLRRRGACTKATLLLLPSTHSLVTLVARVFSGGGATPAPSVSRLSVHEYAELQRKMEEGGGGAGGAGGPEDDSALEDKATQTLPEELTQELLQSLREKLDDPDNYREARDMIEHLYDLIKVEESCNRNDRGDSASLDLEGLDETEENVYDVIGPRRKKSEGNAAKTTRSTGTRAPSPDKLLGPERRVGALVCEYAEPKDRRVHLYTELQSGGREETQATSPGLCDYGEPTDSRVHVYTELPQSRAQVQTNRMANRPLPSKPGRPPSIEL